MAKQTLDLFKLFKLVVDKGGLVEVSDKNLRHFFNCLYCCCCSKLDFIFLLVVYTVYQLYGHFPGY